MKKFEKVWKVWKVWKSLEKFGKVWKSLEKFERIWESLRKFEKVWESLRKTEKDWKRLRYSIFVSYSVTQLVSDRVDPWDAYASKHLVKKGGASSGLFYTSWYYQINISQHGQLVQPIHSSHSGSVCNLLISLTGEGLFTIDRAPHQLRD